MILGVEFECGGAGVEFGEVGDGRHAVAAAVTGALESTGGKEALQVGLKAPDDTDTGAGVGDLQREGAVELAHGHVDGSAARDLHAGAEGVFHHVADYDGQVLELYIQRGTAGRHGIFHAVVLGPFGVIAQKGVDGGVLAKDLVFQVSRLLGKGGQILPQLVRVALLGQGIEIIPMVAHVGRRRAARSMSVLIRSYWSFWA